MGCIPHMDPTQILSLAPDTSLNTDGYDSKIYEYYQHGQGNPSICKTWVLPHSQIVVLNYLPSKAKSTSGALNLPSIIWEKSLPLYLHASFHTHLHHIHIKSQTETQGSCEIDKWTRTARKKLYLFSSLETMAKFYCVGETQGQNLQRVSKATHFGFFNKSSANIIVVSSIGRHVE